MKIEKPNNPIAFPTLVYNQTTGEPNGHEKGMTLRDYFATKAMNGYISASLDVIAHGMIIDHTNIAEQAYLLADAMLKQREL